MENKYKENSAKRIKELRLSRNYTMEKLAELVGVSKSTIAKWENGYVENMRQDRVAKLATIFGVKPTYIMGYDENEISENDEHFIQLYSRLNEHQKKLVDNMMSALIEKQ
jgi:transcriptional regulator with XRE-family HTH domain